jgi:hypothetical protein
LENESLQGIETQREFSKALNAVGSGLGRHRLRQNAVC